MKKERVSRKGISTIKSAFQPKYADKTYLVGLKSEQGLERHTTGTRLAHDWHTTGTRPARYTPLAQRKAHR